MEKFIEKSIIHITKIFPAIYDNRTKRGSYHFAVGLSKNRIIAVGVNHPEQPNPKALRFAQQLGLSDKLSYPFIHSEEDLVSKLIGMNKLSSSIKVVVLRINRFGKLCQSAPCRNCKTVLDSYGLNRVWYSTAEGEICSA